MMKTDRTMYYAGNSDKVSLIRVFLYKDDRQNEVSKMKIKVKGHEPMTKK